jgi:threonine/homoserine/homoserine lactone efflux protein
MLTDLLALALFTFTASVTPGPNNVMLMTSGVNYGFRRSLQHIAGVVIGFVAMVAIGALGFAGLFAAMPQLKTAITAAGVVYLLYLAVRIAFSPVTLSASGRPRAVRRPLTFLEAALFQWVNPKGWVMMIGVVSVYVPLNGVVAVLIAFFLAGAFGSVLWAWFGTVLARALSQPRQLRMFNLAMAALLVLSLAPAIRELWYAFAGGAT